jgi:hypothetical protein
MKHENYVAFGCNEKFEIGNFTIALRDIRCSEISKDNDVYMIVECQETHQIIYKLPFHLDNVLAHFSIGADGIIHHYIQVKRMGGMPLTDIAHLWVTNNKLNIESLCSYEQIKYKHLKLIQQSHFIALDDMRFGRNNASVKFTNGKIKSISSRKIEFSDGKIATLNMCKDAINIDRVIESPEGAVTVIYHEAKFNHMKPMIEPIAFAFLRVGTMLFINKNTQASYIKVTAIERILTNDSYIRLKTFDTTTKKYNRCTNVVNIITADDYIKISEGNEDDQTFRIFPSDNGDEIVRCLKDVDNE